MKLYQFLSKIPHFYTPWGGIVTQAKA